MQMTYKEAGALGHRTVCNGADVWTASGGDSGGVRKALGPGAAPGAATAELKSTKVAMT